MPEKEELQERLRTVIRTTCNTVGCGSCSLKWEGGCSATHLESQIIDLELLEIEQ